MDRKLRVLHVLKSDKYSGAENVVITVIKNMRDDIDFAYTSFDGPIRSILEENNIMFYPARTTSTQEIKRVINEFKPDIIQAHDYNMGIKTAIASNKIPVISHIHNNSPWISKYCLKSYGYYFASKKFSKILTVSDSIVQEYVFGKKIASKTLMIGNPFDSNIVLQLSGGIESEKKYDIGFLGRLTPPKNPMRFIRIVNEIKKFNIEPKAIIIGDGELRTNIDEEIKRLKLENNISCVGFQKNPYKLLKQCKIMLMPSDWEGFGLAAVEGLTLGLPVVASPVGGLKNIVNEECGKICVEDKDFCNEIVKLLSDYDYYKLKSNNALKRADEFDNIDSYINTMCKIYDNVSK